MVEELEQIPVNGDPIKDYYQAIADKGYFKDEAEFRTTLADPKSAKDFFDAVSKEHFKDYAEFESTLGLKKKESSDLRSEAKSLVSGSVANRLQSAQPKNAVPSSSSSAKTSTSPSASQSESVSQKLDYAQRVFNQTASGLTPGGNIPEGKPVFDKPKTIADDPKLIAQGSPLQRQKVVEQIQKFEEKMAPEIEQANTIKTLEAQKAQIDQRLAQIAEGDITDPSLNDELTQLTKRSEELDNRLKFEKISLEDQWKAKTGKTYDIAKIPGVAPITQGLLGLDTELDASYIQAPGNRILEGISKIPKGIGILMSSDNDIAEAISWSLMAIPKALWESTKDEGAQPKDNPAYKLGVVIDDWRKSQAHINPLVEDNFSYKLTTALGGDLPMYALAALGGGPGGVSALGAMDNGVSEFEMAYEKTKDANEMTIEDYISKYGNEDGSNKDVVIKTYEGLKGQNPNDVGSKMFLLAGAVGTLEGLPFVGWMNKLDRRTGGMFTDYFKREGISEFVRLIESNAAKPFVQGIEEAGQESISQLLTNTAANQVYDKTRTITEGLDEAGSLGFSMGFLTGGLATATSALEGKRAEAKTQQERNEIDKSLALLAEYKKKLEGGVDVQSKETVVAKKKLDKIENKLAEGDLSDVEIEALQEARTVAEKEFETEAAKDFDKIADQGYVDMLVEKANVLADVAPEQSEKLLKEAETLKEKLSPKVESRTVELKTEPVERAPKETITAVEDVAVEQPAAEVQEYDKNQVSENSEVAKPRENGVYEYNGERYIVDKSSVTKESTGDLVALDSVEEILSSGKKVEEGETPTSKEALPVETVEETVAEIPEDVESTEPAPESISKKTESRLPDGNQTVPSLLKKEFDEVSESVYPQNHKYEGKADYSAKIGSFVLDIRPTERGYQVFLGEPGKDVGGVRTFGQIESWFPSNETELKEVIVKAKTLITKDENSRTNDITPQKKEPLFKKEQVDELRKKQERESLNPDYAQKKQKISDKREEIRKRILDKQKGRLNAMPVDLLPDYVELASTYIQDGVLDVKEFVKRFRADNADLLEGVSDEDLNDVFEETLADEMSKGAVKESKTKKTFDNANANKGLAGSVNTLYNVKSIKGEKAKADELWSQVVANTKSLDEALYEGERVVREGIDGLDGPALSIFSIDLSTKIKKARNAPGKTMAEIADYDARSKALADATRMKLTASAQDVSIVGKYLQDLFMVDPENAVQSIISNFENKQAENFGSIEFESAENVVEIMNTMRETELGKAVFAAYEEKYGSKPKRSRNTSEYKSRKKAVTDVLDDFLGTVLNNSSMLATAIPFDKGAMKAAVDASKKSLTSKDGSTQDAVEKSMEAMEKYYAEQDAKGKTIGTFDETKARSLFTELYEKANKEAERRANLTESEIENEAKIREEAKKVKLEEQIKESLRKSVEKREEKERQKAAKAEEKRQKAKEKAEKKEAELKESAEKSKSRKKEIDDSIKKLESNDEGNAELEKFNKEKEKIDEDSTESALQYSEARTELNEAIAEEKRAEKSLKEAIEYRKKIEKFTGDKNKLGKFIYDLIIQTNTTNIPVNAQWVQNAYQKLNGANTLSASQIQRMQAQARMINMLMSQTTQAVGQTDIDFQRQWNRNVMKAQRIRKSIMDEFSRGDFLDIFGFAKIGGMMSLKTVFGAGGLANGVSWLFSIPRRIGEATIAKGLGLVLGHKNIPWLTKKAFEAKLNGIVVGAEAGAIELVTGPTTSTSEWSANFNPRPLEALRRVREDFNDNTTNLEKSKRIALDLFEGMAISPTAIMRGLNFSDKTVRSSSIFQYQVAYAQEEGVPLDLFLTSNEYEAARDMIDMLASHDTFQNPNLLSYLMGWLSNKGGQVASKYGNKKYIETAGRAFDIFVAKSVIPFRNTPVNVVIEGVKLAFPELSAISAAVNTARSATAETKEMQVYFRTLAARDIYTVGLHFALRAGILALVNAGIMAMTSGGSPEEKERGWLAYFVGNGKRLVIKLGDKKWSLNMNWAAQFGMSMSLIYDDIVREKENPEMDYLDSKAAQAWDSYESARENSFLAGFNEMMKALNEQKESEDDHPVFKRWLAKAILETNTVPFLPSITAQLTQWADMENAKRFVKDEDFGEELYNNIVREKLGFISSVSERIGTGRIKSISIEELSIQYNIWGEPIKSNPDGTLDMIHYLFDFTGSEEYGVAKSSPSKVKIFLKYNQTKDKKFLPPVAPKKLTVKFDEKNSITKELSPQKQNEYQRVLGEKISELLEKGISGISVESLTPEYVQSIYDMAKTSASIAFFLENREYMLGKEGEGSKKTNYISPLDEGLL